MKKYICIGLLYIVVLTLMMSVCVGIASWYNWEYCPPSEWESKTRGLTLIVSMWLSAFFIIDPMVYWDK